MRCPSCGSQGAKGARFCDRCGAALPEAGADPDTVADQGTTAGHGTAARPDPDAAASAEPGDRRIVTALFADLVDYVRMIAEHDPEEVRARVTEALATMADAIERFEGTREKFIGDAVFAVFGWPRVHDDDAVRASLAAMAIRAGLHEIADGGEPMEVRIGIATGEVVAGRPGAGGDLGLTGEAITTAARIQSLARPGEILLEGGTLAASRGRLAVDDRGSVVLRGQSTPVTLHALRGEAGTGAWIPFRAAAPGPLVGRVDELGVLTNAIDRCEETGRGSAVVVVGEAGMGKSRLLAAAETHARAAGFAWTWTENVSYARGEPYRFARLFAQTVADEHGVDSGSLTRRLLFTEDLPLEDARRYGGAIAAIARDAAFSGWEEEAPFMPSDPADVATALLEVATRYVDRLLTMAGPRILVIDDLHWLDPSSVTLVELLVEATAGRPFIVLAGTRPSGIPAWVDRAGVQRLDLQGLAEPETARLATIIARAAVEAEGVRSIQSRIRGLPRSGLTASTSRTGRSSGGMAGSRSSRAGRHASRSRCAPSSARGSTPSSRPRVKPWAWPPSSASPSARAWSRTCSVSPCRRVRSTTWPRPHSSGAATTGSGGSPTPSSGTRPTPGCSPADGARSTPDWQTTSRRARKRPHPGRSPTTG